MAIDDKSKDLAGLRIDRSAMAEPPHAPLWRAYILAGVGITVLLGIAALAYRFIGNTPEVDVVRAQAQGGDIAGAVVLTATGYIVPHHKINVNSKVTGRVKWIGVEKGDHVKEGQVLVKLEDDEFRAQYEQARGSAESARAYLDELQHGSRPEEIAQAQHNLDEARATLANDKLTLDRTRQLWAQGVVSRQSLDDAVARFDSDQQRVNSLEKTLQLSKLGPRAEEIARAKGALTQAEGEASYAESLLDATVIRAPVNGTILERTAEKGELITAQFASSAEGGPQGSVVSLADLNDIQADLDIAQDDYAKLTPHQKVVVSVDAFPDLHWNGEIAEVSPEANRQKATIEVKVHILNPDSHLRPEMNTTVGFIADNSSEAEQSSEKRSARPSSENGNAEKPVRVKDVQYRSMPNSTRVSVNLGQDVQFESQRIDHPDRIFFDLKNARVGSHLAGQSFRVDDGLVRKIRIAQHEPRRARVVIETANRAAYNASLVPGPPRLVIDIHPEEVHPAVANPEDKTAETTDAGRGATSQAVGAYVPTAAIRDNKGNKYVLLAFEGRAMKRDVKVLSQRSGGALVSALNGGETVITTAPEGLKDGDKIKIKRQ